MRVAIVGSRDYPNEAQVRAYVRTLPRDTVIISGGCRGPDTWAVEEARKCGLEWVEYEAEWTRYGRSAGPKRNSVIASKCDRLVAFWNGQASSRGTLDVIEKARANGVPIEVREFDMDWATSPTETR